MSQLIQFRTALRKFEPGSSSLKCTANTCINPAPLKFSPSDRRKNVPYRCRCTSVRRVSAAASEGCQLRVLDAGFFGHNVKAGALASRHVEITFHLGFARTRPTISRVCAQPGISHGTLLVTLHTARTEEAPSDKRHRR